MWELVIIPMLTLFIGFLCGVMVADGAGRNMQLDNINKKLRRLENDLRKQNQV